MNPITFSFNIIQDLKLMLGYGFMLHAFEAGTIVAIIAGIVGYFVVLRRSSFAAHALSHIGFAGAAGAVLMGVNPIFGLLVFTSSGGIIMALLERKAASRDVEIGTVLAFMLGLGVLFISLYSGYATEAYSLLFGEILGISSANVTITLVAGLVILLAVSLIYHPLLFSSLDEDVAEAKGLSMIWIGILFMLLVAVATSIAVQVVGVLLIFALMVTPAAIAMRLSKKPFRGMMISVAIALLVTWFGLFVSFYEPYPVSFFIASAVFLLYLLTRGLQKITNFSLTERK
ncbi:metal ABC transporter permease [Patescibacteria group bacterium]|nr:metal ABC transporter permease [Patescibacteria group bacterium]MCL5114178.1 metal ABC transporter permease [Patescibacteria group bacterium]